jgi:hypothetical protein
MVQGEARSKTAGNNVGTLGQSVLLEFGGRHQKKYRDTTVGIFKKSTFVFVEG